MSFREHFLKAVHLVNSAVFDNHRKNEARHPDTPYALSIQIEKILLPTGLVLISLIVVMAMPPPMVIVVILVVPVSFVPFPAFPIVVVVRMRPARPFKRRTLPMSSHPLVMVAHRSPISFDPNESPVGRKPRFFINDGWWRGPDIHRNLC
jgi:hypothetical protein